MNDEQIKNWVELLLEKAEAIDPSRFDSIAVAELVGVAKSAVVLLKNPTQPKGDK